MNPLLLLVCTALCVASLRAEALPKPVSNITVLGSVYCDACSNNTFSKHSYFLKGAKVLVECKFKVNSASKEEMSITAERTTDRFGVYKLEVPAVDGFECRQGREVKSMCRASLMRSSSVRCDVAALRSSAEHVAVKSREGAACYFNLNALSYKPARRNAVQCGTAATQATTPPSGAWSSGADGASLFFWPIFPPFGLPWSSLPFPFLLPPSLPFPFPHVPLPDPSSLPFSIPSWLLPFLKPPYFPCPLASPRPDTPSPPAAR